VVLTQAPLCGYAVTYTVKQDGVVIPLNASFPLASSASSKIAYNDNTKYYLKSERLADSWGTPKPAYGTKVYTMTLVASLNDVFYTASRTVNQSNTWTISMTDPCKTATFTDTVTISDITTTVKLLSPPGAYITQTF